MAEYLSTAASRALSQNCDTPANNWKNALYLRAAANILGSHRKAEANDPDAYCTAIMHVLVQYPLDAVNIGVQRLAEERYLPNAYDVRRVMEDVYGPTRRRLEGEKVIAKQLAERERLASIGPPSQTYEQVREEMAERGMQLRRRDRVMSDEASTLKKKHELTDAQWAAIPDLPPNHSDYWAGVRWTK